MTKNCSAGDYIDAWCTKCKLESGHTIVAMVDDKPKKVQCNTCKGKHNFRTKPTKKSRATSKASTKKTKTQETDHNHYMSLLEGFNISNAKQYSMEGNFGKNEIIDHPKFGIGIVVSIRQLNRIDILFKDGPKLLVQNQL